MHLWLLQLAALCSRSDNGCDRVLSHPSWNNAQRAAGMGLVGTGAGTCPSLAPGWGGIHSGSQGRTFGISQPCHDPAGQQKSPARSPLVSLAPRAAGVKG